MAAHGQPTVPDFGNKRPTANPRMLMPAKPKKKDSEIKDSDVVLAD